MQEPQILGIVGAALLVIGAAYPLETVSHPSKSKKNWLYAIGSACMFGYAFLNYLDGGSVFFVILQVFINATSIPMLLGTDDRLSTPFIVLVGMGMIVWSVNLFEGYSTALFIVGLTTIGVGFALKMGTVRRNMALALGSVLIAYFSYLSSDWIFVGLNTFFAFFSAYHVMKLCSITHHRN